MAHLPTNIKCFSSGVLFLYDGNYIIKDEDPKESKLIKPQIFHHFSTQNIYYYSNQQIILPSGQQTTAGQDPTQTPCDALSIVILGHITGLMEQFHCVLSW